MNVGHATDSALERVPDRVALVVDGNTYTFRQLEALIRQSCSALAAAGVQPGDRVALVNLESARCPSPPSSERRGWVRPPPR